MGNQIPTLMIVPECESSDWKRCHDLNKVGGITMLEWQDLVLEGWLGLNRFGRWAASVGLEVVPRQNGKTLGTVEPRANYGMLYLGEQVLYTAHLQKTSTETFEDMATFFDSPKLRKHVKSIKTALGREQIVLNDRRTKGGSYVPGGRIKFLARTRNGGRGQHGDLLIFDEALELSEDSQASFLPAISASKNPQTLYTTTPPTSESQSSVLRDLIAKVTSGNASRTSLHMWGVTEIGDISDKSRWYEVNPSMGILINEETVEAELDQLGELAFAIERLGYMPPLKKGETAIDPQLWQSSSIPSIGGSYAHLQTIGVKFSPDDSTYSMAGCKVDADGNAAFELVEHASTSHGVRELAERVAAASERVACVVVDGKGYADTFCSYLFEHDVPYGYVVRPKTADVANAAAMVVDGLKDGTVRHVSNGGQVDLDESGTESVKRSVGGGWSFGGEKSTPIEAAAMALFGARTTKRDPNQVQEASF